MSLSLSCQLVEQSSELYRCLAGLSFRVQVQGHTGLDAERSRFIGSRGNYTAALRVSAHDYRLSL